MSPRSVRLLPRTFCTCGDGRKLPSSFNSALPSPPPPPFLCFIWRSREKVRGTALFTVRCKKSPSNPGRVSSCRRPALLRILPQFFDGFGPPVPHFPSRVFLCPRRCTTLLLFAKRFTETLSSPSLYIHSSPHFSLLPQKFQSFAV